MAAQTQSPDMEQLRPGEPRDPQLRRSWSKLVVLAGVVALLLVVVYLSPLRQYVGDLGDLSQRIRGFGPLAPLVLTVSVALLVAAGFPRLVFCVLAGMALGFWSGLLWAQVGTLVGNYVLFLVIRALGTDWGRRLLSKRATLRATVQQRGALGVVLARQLPLPGLVVNVACALLPIRHVDFLLGTIIGQLPQAIPWTLIGAGLLQPSLRRSIGVMGLAVAIAIAAWFGLRYTLDQRASGLRDQPPVLPED
jgi:uncharacterized membrane protein YdjX (TVP38/TMEM64 family)